MAAAPLSMDTPRTLRNSTTPVLPTLCECPTAAWLMAHLFPTWFTKRFKLQLDPTLLRKRIMLSHAFLSRQSLSCPAPPHHLSLDYHFPDPELLSDFQIFFLKATPTSGTSFCLIDFCIAIKKSGIGVIIEIVKFFSEFYQL